MLLGYGDRISVVAPPPFPADFPIPPKEKKFKGYFKIARHYGWALNHTFQVIRVARCQMAKFDLSLFLGLRQGGGQGAQSKERKGSNLAA